MSPIYKLKRKDGIRYQVKIRKKNIKRTFVFDKKSDAVAWEEENNFTIFHNLPLPPFPGEEKPTEGYACKKALEKYLLVVSPTKNGRNAEKQDAWDATALIAYFGNMNIFDIKRSHIESYMEARLQGTGIFLKSENSRRKGLGVGNSSVRHEISLLSDMFNNARLRWGFEDLHNPCSDIKRPAQPEQRKRVLTELEATNLLKAAQNSKQTKLYPFVLLTLHGAMRPSEAAGLQWEEIGWEQRTLYIPESRVKTSSQRRVPLTNDAYLLLKELKEEADPENPNVLLPATKNVHAMSTPSAYFNRSFKTAAKNAKLDDVTPYTLRHTGGTHMIGNGIDVGTVSKIMGHSNIDQTMKYVHLVDSVKVEAIQVLNGLGTG